MSTNSTNFRTEYFYHKDSNDTAMRKCIKVWYFALTTLATIGYGDYHPVSTEERLVGLLILLFGVTMFSFIMGQFMAIIMYIN